jgi:RND family efflux transporter MFP subunit
MRIEKMHILENLNAYRILQKLIIASSLLSILALVGCAEKEPPPQVQDVSRPVKTMVIAGADVAGMRSFPARIAASARADLSFRIPGTVKELPVKEGDRLLEGDLVARLDTTDYQIVVDDKRATYENAKKNFERGKKLIKSGTISQFDFDKLEAKFKNAQAALNTATQDLVYTELKAPFDGIIATREVDRFEEVRAKQKIVILQNIEMLEVKFDAPESIKVKFDAPESNIRRIRAGEAETGMRARDKIRVVASFEGQPETRYPLTFKEVSTKE